MQGFIKDAAKQAARHAPAAGQRILTTATMPEDFGHWRTNPLL